MPIVKARQPAVNNIFLYAHRLLLACTAHTSIADIQEYELKDVYTKAIVGFSMRIGRMEYEYTMSVNGNGDHKIIQVTPANMFDFLSQQGVPIKDSVPFILRRRLNTNLEKIAADMGVVQSYLRMALSGAETPNPIMRRILKSIIGTDPWTATIEEGSPDYQAITEYLIQQGFSPGVIVPLLLKLAGIKMSALAKAAGINKSYLYRIIHKPEPSVRARKILAEALGIDVFYRPEQPAKGQTIMTTAPIINVRSENIEASDIKTAPIINPNQPGALRGGGHIYIETKQVQRLYNGRERTKDKEPIVGLVSFAQRMRYVWGAAAMDDPYADWYLLRIDEALKSIQSEIKQATTRMTERIQSVPNIDISVAHSIKPISKPLNFPNAYGYMASYVLTDFDELVRSSLTACHTARMTRDECREIFRHFNRLIRRTFLLPMQWKNQVITRDDIRLMTQRGVKAIELMGELPQEVLDGTRRAPHAPPIHKPGDKGVESNMTTLLDDDDD